MRSIFWSIKWKVDIDYRRKDIDEVNKFINDIQELKGQVWHIWIWDIDRVIGNLTPLEYVKHNENYHSINGLLHKISQFASTQRGGQPRMEKILKCMDNFFNREVFPAFLEVDNSIKVYVPLLRWLKNPIPHSENDLYKSRTVFDYFYNKDETWPEFEEYFDNNFKNDKPAIGFEVFTGLSIFEDVTKMLLWDHEDRENIKNFEEFLWTHFFNWQKVVLTPKYEKDVLYVKIWKNPDRAIYNLWDGVQNIIISTFPIFKYQNKNLSLFIEEPETWLHPWMQRILLETFTHWIESEGIYHQIFLTSHSNHLLDIALDDEINSQISIYEFSETWNENENNIEYSNWKSEVLDLLWVRNSSVFLSNCIIWVEWVSDRIYIKKFLDLFQEKYKNEEWFKLFEEDKHFSIVEYGWSNITHYNFWDEKLDPYSIKVDSISRNNFLMADNDWPNASDGKKERIKELCKIFDDDRIYVDMPEIENVITYDQYIQYINKYPWNNWWLIWTPKTEEEFNRLVIEWDIGTVLKETLISLIRWKVSKRFTEWNDISIIGQKKDIAERMVIFMDEYDKLSDKAQLIWKKLHNFIKDHN